MSKRSYQELGVPLNKMTWFRVGGPAEILYKPPSVSHLQEFLSTHTLPLWVLGAGSNVLVRDGGVPGITIRLTKGFSSIERENDTIIVGAGCLNRTLALYALERELSGFEFLIGIPGTIGGSVVMNAGAYGGEVKDIILWVDVVDEKGNLKRISNFLMSYRKGNLQKNHIVVRAAFKGTPKLSSLIGETLNYFLSKKKETQPIQGKTGGSTFKNPKFGLKAWEYIDKAGCRGLRLGDAQVSEKHCNFLLNLGNASAFDLETLAEDVRHRVLKSFGVDLEWEIHRVGIKSLGKVLAV